MDTTAIHDGSLETEALKTRLLLAVAHAMGGIGIVWMVCCAGGLFVIAALAPRVSDAIADGIPLALAGNLGFALAWSTALLARRLAAAQPRRILRLARQGRQRRRAHGTTTLSHQRGA